MSKKSQFHPKPDPVLLKFIPTSHPLSSELQQYYLKITENCFGFNEQLRNENLLKLSQDYNVKFLTTYLIQFIKEAIDVNLAFPDLSLLIYSVRMVKSLLSNPFIDLKYDLQIILPSVLSCVLSKKICKYTYDNHWTLRDFSAQIVSIICYSYSNKTNNITKRVINVYLKAIKDNIGGLTTLYGALKGLASLGEEAIKIFLIPYIPLISQRLYNVLEKQFPNNPNCLNNIGTFILNNKNSDDVKLAGKRVKDLILTIASPILLKFYNVNDGGVIYVNKFGYLGYYLYASVKLLEDK